MLLETPAQAMITWELAYLCFVLPRREAGERVYLRFFFFPYFFREFRVPKFQSEFVDLFLVRINDHFRNINL